MIHGNHAGYGDVADTYDGRIIALIIVDSIHSIQAVSSVAISAMFGLPLSLRVANSGLQGADNACSRH